MKQVTINEKVLNYKNYNGYHNGYRSIYTIFYTEEETITTKVRGLFSSKDVVTIKPKVLFRLNIDIENPKHSKVYVRTLIEEQLGYLDRAEEIKRGEIC